MKAALQKTSRAPRARQPADLVHELELQQLELEMQNAELREAQVALETSRARYARLYDDAPVGYCSLDERGVIIDINRRGAELLGKTQGQLLRKHLRSSFPVPSRRALDEHLRRCLRYGERSVSELTLLVGEVEEVEIVSVPESPGTYSSGCLTALTNITARRAADRERARLFDEATAARAHAELANQTKDEFLAVVSHELRSPVAAMLMWIHLMRTNGHDPAFRQQALDAIELSNKAQLKLLEDLLDVARSRSGKLQLDRKPLALASLVEGAVMSAGPLAAEKRVRLSLSVDRELGVIDGDEVRLGQVIGNLIANAIKFSASEGEVRVRAAADGATAVIEVQDDGVGIPPDLLPHVFELFRQDDKPLGAHRRGLGVGLAVVRELVEAHGGTTHAASAGRGHGATMTVRLPRLPAEGGELALAAAAGREPPGDAPNALAGVQVMVIEDDPEMRAVMSQVLRSHGAEVNAAASLAEGRDLLRRTQPRVLVSDIMLPDGDGFTLVRELRQAEEQKGWHTPAVALTSLACARERALAAGFDRHLAKPVEADVLVTCIAQLARAA